MTTSTKLLEELLLESEEAAEPGDWKVDDVVHRPDASLPVPMVASTLTSAGHVYIYDTLSGARSVTNRNMLGQQLKKTRPDGSKVFTTAKPAIEPVRGTITCLLHASRPERAAYAAMGWEACRKATLPSEFQLRQHMAHRHRVEWATIEDQRLQRERQEDREFQRALIIQAGKSQPVDVLPKTRRRRKS